MNYSKHETALVSEEAIIGEGSRVWAFTNIQAGAVIGRNCNICDGSFVEKGAVIGDNVTVKHHVSIFDGVIIEDDVFIGSNIAFINDRYPRGNNNGQWILEKTFIKKGVTIGTNSVILCGITIGEYAVVGAGSVIVEDVPAYRIAAGNPAKLKGYACQCGKGLDSELKCVCGKQYALNEQRLGLL